MLRIRPGNFPEARKIVMLGRQQRCAGTKVAGAGRSGAARRAVAGSAEDILFLRKLTTWPTWACVLMWVSSAWWLARGQAGVSCGCPRAINGWPNRWNQSRSIMCPAILLARTSSTAFNSTSLGTACTALLRTPKTAA